jgi:hypothetical protein
MPTCWSIETTFDIDLGFQVAFVPKMAEPPQRMVKRVVGKVLELVPGGQETQAAPRAVKQMVIDSERADMWTGGNSKIKKYLITCFKLYAENVVAASPGVEAGSGGTGLVARFKDLLCKYAKAATVGTGAVTLTSTDSKLLSTLREGVRISGDTFSSLLIAPTQPLWTIAEAKENTGIGAQYQVSHAEVAALAMRLVQAEPACPLVERKFHVKNIDDESTDSGSDGEGAYALPTPTRHRRGPVEKKIAEKAGGARKRRPIFDRDAFDAIEIDAIESGFDLKKRTNVYFGSDASVNMPEGMGELYAQACAGADFDSSDSD